LSQPQASLISLALFRFTTSQEGAYADVLVKLGLIKLLQKKFDVCETA